MEPVTYLAKKPESSLSSQQNILTSSEFIEKLRGGFVFEGPVIVKGDVRIDFDFKGPLPSDLHINGNLYLEHLSLPELSEKLTVSQYLTIYHCNLKKLSSYLKVDWEVHIGWCHLLEKLADFAVIGRALNISDCHHISSLSVSIETGSLDLRNLPNFKSIAKELTITGSTVSFAHCPNFSDFPRPNMIKKVTIYYMRPCPVFDDEPTLDWLINDNIKMYEIEDPVEYKGDIVPNSAFYSNSRYYS